MLDLEGRRLSALRNYRVLDTSPEPAFDRITALAADLFGAPMAAISLVDEDRQWFKSSVGLNICSTARDEAFCDHTIRLDRDGVMVVEDATKDPRFADNPLVTAKDGIRFYAGAVLTSPDGYNLGSLCVVDIDPRPRPRAADLERLKMLAAMVVDELERRREQRVSAHRVRLLEMAETMSGVGRWYYRLSDGFIFWSDEVYAIHGVSRETFAPDISNAMSFYELRDRVRLERMVGEAIATGRGYDFEMRLRTPAGDRKHVTCRAACDVDEHGEPYALYGVFRDVTEQVETLHSLELARAEAEAASATKARFLANMTHELRTPLTAVLGYTRLAQMKPELDGHTRGMLDQVVYAGEALLATVNDVLDFSKLEAGQFEIKPTPMAPAETARAVLELLRLQADAKGVALAARGLETLPAMVLSDPDRLRQVLLNLVGNALKFTDRGEVRLEVGHEDGELRFTVIDTGAGIAPEKLGRLFRRFSQVDADGVRDAGGTGLGLAICKGLVEAMGGVVGVASTPGVGSRFWFTAPAAPVEVRPAEPARDVVAPAGARVLVVDDNPMNRHLIRALLTPCGLQIEEAQDGPEAIACAADRPFDLIMMDMNMPGIDGRTAARRIRAAQGPNRTIPILAFSADDVPIAADDVFDGCIAKPITVDGLKQGLAEAMTEGPAIAARRAA